MKRPSKVSMLIAAGALLSVWSAPALADGYITAGTEGWYQSAPEAKYQEFREVPRGLFVESFLWRDRFWKGNLNVYGSNLIRSDENIGGVYRRPRWHFDLDYRETPHNISFITRTGYAFASPGVQLLPDSLQARNQANAAGYTARMQDYLNHADKIPLGINTNVITSHLGGRAGNGLSFQVTGSRRDRDGGKPYGGSFGFSNAVEVVEPIRQHMNEGTGLLSYRKNRLTAEANVNYSSFQNDISTLLWDNPRTLTDQVGTPNHGALDLYPDNQAWHAGGEISLVLPRRSVLNLSANYGQATQNDKWLPMTTNTAPGVADSVAAHPLPGTSTDAKANITNYDARLITHPVGQFSGVLRFYDHKYDNKTKVYEFAGQVPYDGSWSGTPVENEAFGNEQRVYGADVDWNPITKIGMTGTYDHTDRFHMDREIPKDHEDAYQGMVRIRPHTAWELDAKYRHGVRWSHDFDLAVYDSAEQANLRRYDVAPRTQNLADGTLSWSGIEKLTLAATVEYLRNEYTAVESAGVNLTMGLQDELRKSGTLTATLELTSRIDMSGSFGIARMYSNQLSRQSSGAALSTNPSDNWRARLYDDIYTFDGSTTWHAKPDKLDFIGTYFYDRSPGVFRLTNATSTAQDLPTTDYKRQGVGIEGDYKLDEQTQFGARWQWEQYDVTDFATEDIPLIFPTTGATTAIFLGDSSLDYRANAVSAFVRRSW